jgi:hypothetical protein
MFARKAIILAALLTLPVSAFAQSADSKYCNALLAKWREYNKKSDPDTSFALAMTQCDSKPGEAIPVLEKGLKNENIPLPTR